MVFVKGQSGNINGRTKGVANKSTIKAREAISMFVDNNVHRLEKWLDDIANGVKDASGDVVVNPNPLEAFKLFTSVIEYHIPKLQRSEHQNLDKNGNPADQINKIEVVFVESDSNKDT